MELYTDQQNIKNPYELIRLWEYGGNFKLVEDFELTGGTILRAGSRVNSNFFNYFSQNDFVLQSDRFQISIRVRESEQQ